MEGTVENRQSGSGRLRWRGAEKRVVAVAIVAVREEEKAERDRERDVEGGREDEGWSRGRGGSWRVEADI